MLTGLAFYRFTIYQQAPEFPFKTRTPLKATSEEMPLTEEILIRLEKIAMALEGTSMCVDIFIPSPGDEHRSLPEKCCCVAWSANKGYSHTMPEIIQVLGVFS